MTEERELTEFQRRLNRELGGFQNVGGLHCLINRLWEITHGPQETVEDRLAMLNDLCLATGVAVAVLHEIAKDWKKHGQSAS